MPKQTVKFPLRLEAFALDGCDVQRSGFRWVCANGQRCRAGEVIAWCNIGLAGRPGSAFQSSPFYEEARDFQVALAPRRSGRLIKARGASSALSAANGAIDHVKSLLQGTPANDWVSMATVSKGEYGVPAGLVFGYPCKTDGKGNYAVVEGLKFDAFGQQKFAATLKELLEEKEAVKALIPT